MALGQALSLPPARPYLPPLRVCESREAEGQGGDLTLTKQEPGGGEDKEPQGTC